MLKQYRIYDIYELTTVLILLYLQRQKQNLKFSECTLSMPDGSHSPLYLRAKGFHLPAILSDTLLAVYGGIQLDDGTIAHVGDSIKFSKVCHFRYSDVICTPKILFLNAF